MRISSEKDVLLFQSQHCNAKSTSVVKKKDQVPARRSLFFPSAIVLFPAYVIRTRNKLRKKVDVAHPYIKRMKVTDCSLSGGSQWKVVHTTCWKLELLLTIDMEWSMLAMQEK